MSRDIASFWATIADQFDELEGDEDVPRDWQGWLVEMFPAAITAGFGDHHVAFWEWAWAVARDERPRPFVGVWPRGGGKSTSGELAVAAFGARGHRRYAVYVSATQNQADKRVAAISALLESEAVMAHYPALGQRALSKFGSSKGWRRNRLQTASGFIVDGLGLETAARGLKVEHQRPDLIILDDVDDRHDTLNATAKKIEIITDTILPMGNASLAVLVLQNLIIPHGVVGQLADGRASFLIDREVSGPIPAVIGLQTKNEPLGDGSGRVRAVITAGEATWGGQDLQACQGLIDTSGLDAMLREQQHEVDRIIGALWKVEMFRRIDHEPELVRIVIGVDPSGGGDEIGIIVAGMRGNGVGVLLEDATQPGSLGPGNWAATVISCYDRWEADLIVAEANFGGDMVRNTIELAAGPAGGYIPIELVHASRGKQVRAEPIVGQYERGAVEHLGHFPELETELTTWVPGIGDSPNRLDGLVWAFHELFLPAEQTESGGSARPPGM